MFSVRLACVRHAASVRPEPGSNSLFKLYIQTLSRLYIDPSNYDSLAITFVIFSSFLTSQSSKFLWIFKGFVLCSALFNFQGTSSQLVSCNFYIISHLEVFVKWTFCECFWTFIHPFIPHPACPLSSFFSLRSLPCETAYLLYHTSELLSSK